MFPQGSEPEAAPKEEGPFWRQKNSSAPSEPHGARVVRGMNTPAGRRTDYLTTLKLAAEAVKAAAEETESAKQLGLLRRAAILTQEAVDLVREPFRPAGV